MHKSRTMTFWTRWSKRPFSRSAKTIDGREKRKCQLALEPQNSRAYEKKRVCEQATLYLKNSTYKNSQIVLKSTFFVDRIPLNIFARFSVLLVQ